jgi:hypothetical protein
MELCKTYDNVYCEFGYLHEVMDDKTLAGEFERNFRREWNAPEFRRKCMYGSDSHMPDMLDETARYLRYFRKLFQGTPSLADFDAFCAGNALKFLNLETYLARLKKLNVPGLDGQYPARLRALLA